MGEHRNNNDNNKLLLLLLLLWIIIIIVQDKINSYQDMTVKSIRWGSGYRLSGSDKCNDRRIQMIFLSGERRPVNRHWTIDNK